MGLLHPLFFLPQVVWVDLLLPPTPGWPDSLPRSEASHMVNAWTGSDACYHLASCIQRSCVSKDLEERLPNARHKEMSILLHQRPKSLTN